MLLFSSGQLCKIGSESGNHFQSSFLERMQDSSFVHFKYACVISLDYDICYFLVLEIIELQTQIWELEKTNHSQETLTQITGTV